MYAPRTSILWASFTLLFVFSGSFALSQELVAGRPRAIPTAGWVPKHVGTSVQPEQEQKFASIVQHTVPPQIVDQIGPARCVKC